ncbi:MAG: Tfp pilus assembly protein PilN [Enterobacterales bacterium]|jgi:Tfp pilus assembly protein PilN
MKQQVNFYTEEFKPKKDLLSLDNMLVTWITGVVLILALYNLEYKKTQIAKKNLEMTQASEQHQQSQLNTLQATFSKRGDSLVLEKTHQAMQASLSQRNYVIAQLSQRAGGMQKGIAGLMENLALITVDGLWLTNISVNQGQLSVSGITNDAEKVPQLIQKLQNISSLKDKRFSRLEIKTTEDNSNFLTFTLQSENQVRGLTQHSRSSR